MKYTLSKGGDAKIEKDMKIICRELNSRISGVISIILTGGFARGEGSVRKVGKKIYPYNDYDIQVVCSKKISKGEIDKISVEVSRKLGYRGIVNFYPLRKEEQKMKENFYIDLKVDSVSDLKKMLPRIRTYELKNDSLVLFGEDLRSFIPDCKLTDVPLAEGAKLLLDRMSQMIEYYSTEGKHEKEFLTYIIQQAYASCCTSLLLLSGRYELGYKKSMKIFKENYEKDFPSLYEKIPDLDEKIEKFIKWKSNPKNLSNVEEEWFVARKNILIVSQYFFSKFLGREIKDIDQFSCEILKMGRKFYGPYLKEKFKVNPGMFFPAWFLKYKYYKRLKKKPSLFFRRRSPGLIIFSSLIYFISSISEDGVNERCLKKGVDLLSKVYPVRGVNWEEISMEYANAYIAFFMQKI